MKIKLGHNVYIIYIQCTVIVSIGEIVLKFINAKPRLNEILDERGISQLKLSQITGISQSAINRFDRNKQHLDNHLFIISRVLGITIEELFEVEEEENK
ncbi:helix-turn-helix domain-containing protein [Bacillus haynesii]|uniref:helix-turn-helix domain-containing protein n=1 Tax=Bacillus haynesii TaxID=1925021 RepID=UPI0009E6401A|nr:helix-turn-helix transcriptional regulator [Bacillus haynesii]